MKHKRSRKPIQQPTYQREPFGPKTLAAGVVDGIIILFICCAMFGIPDYANGQSMDPIILIVTAVMYTIGLNNSPAQRTIGRMVMGIK